MGTGPFDFDGYDPTDPESQTQQFKNPAASTEGQFGILSDQQKAQMAFQMQRSLQQQQLMNQQRMLQMQMLQQNMGVNIGKLGEGFGFPVMNAYNAGNKLSNALNNIINSREAKQAGIQAPPQGGMLGIGSSNDDSIAAILHKHTQSDPDTATAYIKASAEIASTFPNDPHAQQVASLMRIQGNQKQIEAGKTAAETAKDTAQANEANQNAAAKKAELGNPGATFEIHLPNGNLGRAYLAKNPDGSFAGFKQLPWEGPNMQIQLDSTPGGREKALGEFRDQISNAVGAVQKIDQLSVMAGTGKAAMGWAEVPTTFVDNLVGAAKQLIPSQTNIDPDAQKLWESMKGPSGTFSSWAQKTGQAESMWSDLTMQLAATYAKGSRISNQDIQRATHTLGEHLTNPSTVVGVLQDVKQRTIDDIHRNRDLMKLSPGNKEYQDTIDNYSNFFDQKVKTDGPTAPGGTPDADGWTTMPNGAKVRLKQ